MAADFTTLPGKSVITGREKESSFVIKLLFGGTLIWWVKRLG